MYNESLKQQYLNQRSHFSKKGSDNIRNILRRLEPYEKKAKKDFCFINDKETVVRILSGICGYSAGGIRNKISMLKGYVNWCKETLGDSVSDIINTITVDDLGTEAVRKYMVSDSADLQECLNAIFDPEDNLSVDNVYRAYFWFAFMGIPEQDVFTIRGTEVSFKRKCISIGDHDYPFPKEAYTAIYNCVKLDKFKVTNDHYANTTYFLKDRFQGEEIMRRTVGNNSAAEYDAKREAEKCRTYVSIIVTKRAPERILSRKHVELSGYFYRLHERETLGVKIDFFQVAKLIAEERGYPDNDEPQTRKLLLQLQRHITDEYSRWLKAFY